MSAQMKTDFDWNGPCWLFNDMNKQVLNKNLRWDYYRRNHNGHQIKHSFDSIEWLVFPTCADAERYIHAQKMNLFHFSMRLLQDHELESYRKYGQL